MSAPCFFIYDSVKAFRLFLLFKKWKVLRAQTLINVILVNIAKSVISVQDTQESPSQLCISTSRSIPKHPSDRTIKVIKNTCNRDNNIKVPDLTQYWKPNYLFDISSHNIQTLGSDDIFKMSAPTAKKFEMNDFVFLCMERNLMVIIISWDEFNNC